MQRIAESGSVRYLQLVVESPGEYAPPFPSGAYACLLWDTRGSSSLAARTALARRLLRSGCVCVVCGGETCELWHDLVDEELADLQATGVLPGDRLVTTTWHRGESPGEVAEYFVRTALPAEGPVAQHLVLQIGQDPAMQAELWGAVLSPARA